MKTLISLYKKFRKSMRQVPKIPLIILCTLVFLAVFADLLPLQNPEIGEPQLRLLPPCWEKAGDMKYLLGTDTMGRDILTRLIYGARVSLLVAFTAVILSAAVGAVVGIFSGFMGGWMDLTVMRLLDAWLSFPTIIFAILMSVIVGPGIFNIIVIMALVFWARYARLVRGETLSLKSRDFVHLATIAGCSKFRIMRRHILPNVMNTIITFASLQIGLVVVVEASLTFLGVGVPAPKPAWGLMISEGKGGLFSGQWWLIILPGIAISMLVISFNLLGDWLRRRLDPHIRDQ